MAKRISDLPISGSTTAGDQYEVDQAGVSKRQAASQVATFMETNLSKLILTGLGIELHNDGSCTFAGNSAAAFSIDLSGNTIIGIGVGAGVVGVFELGFNNKASN